MLKKFALAKFNIHWKTLSVFLLGIIIYDSLAHLMLFFANVFPLKSKLFNVTIDGNINNLFLLIDISLIFILLHFIFLHEREIPRNRHWYE